MFRRRRKWVGLGTAAKLLGVSYSYLYREVVSGRTDFRVHVRRADDCRRYRYLDYAEIMEATNGAVNQPTVQKH